MNLEPLVDYIDSNTDLVKAKTVFEYSMPAQVKKGVVLVHEPGNAFIDHEIGGIYMSRIQAIVRDVDYLAGRTRAEEIMALLTMERVGLPAYSVDYCRPRHSPFPFSRSEGDKIEFSVNFDIRYRH